VEQFTGMRLALWRRRVHRIAFAFTALVVAGAPLARAVSNPLPGPLAGRPSGAPVELAASGEAPDTVPAATPQQQLAELLNVERAICGETGCPLPPLKQVAILDGVADGHSAAMALGDFFSHYDPTDGCSDPWERMVAAGYSFHAAAENIAAANSTAAATLAQWMASPGHRANILGPDFREVGVGRYAQAGDQGNVDYMLNGDCDCVDAGEDCNDGPWFYYWTLSFGRRNSVYPLVIEREAHQTATGNVDLYVYGPGTAVDMRFSNDGVDWSGWQAYDATVSWSLAAGDGRRTVFSEVRTATTTYRACDAIWRAGAGGDELFTDGFECQGWSGWSAVSP
jgi:uncharacterized protein YkwD